MPITRADRWVFLCSAILLFVVGLALLGLSGLIIGTVLPNLGLITTKGYVVIIVLNIVGYTINIFAAELVCIWYNTRMSALVKERINV